MLSQAVIQVSSLVMSQNHLIRVLFAKILYSCVFELLHQAEELTLIVFIDMMIFHT